MLGTFVAFVSSWFASGINVINRRLKDVHFSILGFYHPVLGVILTSIYLVFDKLITG